MMRTPDQSALHALAVRWMHSAQRATCDIERPWPHGRVFLATRYPRYFDYNAVVVEDDPGLSVEELAAVADAELAGLVHRRLDFDQAVVADPLRAEFVARGWRAVRLLWMHHEGERGDPGPAVQPPATVTEVAYEAADPLRAAWHREDSPEIGEDPDHLRQRREVSMRRGARVLAAHRDGVPVGFAQLEGEGDEIEITSVFVLPAHRGRGYGTAVTAAAIGAAGEAAHLWICADDEDRPKRLYARLGFAPVVTTVQFTRLPQTTERSWVSD